MREDWEVANLPVASAWKEEEREKFLSYNMDR